MERLVFTCPRTGKEIDVGIQSELQTLLRIRSDKVSARCPHCGQRHEWQVRDAQLAKAA
jgi:transcription elongation factor Elf1